MVLRSYILYNTHSKQTTCPHVRVSLRVEIILSLKKFGAVILNACHTDVRWGAQWNTLDLVSHQYSFSPPSSKVFLTHGRVLSGWFTDQTATALRCCSPRINLSVSKNKHENKTPSMIYSWHFDCIASKYIICYDLIFSINTLRKKGKQHQSKKRSASCRNMDPFLKKCICMVLIFKNVCKYLSQLAE